MGKKFAGHPLPLIIINSLGSLVAFTAACDALSVLPSFRHSQLPINPALTFAGCEGSRPFAALMAVHAVFHEGNQTKMGVANYGL